MGVQYIRCYINQATGEIDHVHEQDSPIEADAITPSAPCDRRDFMAILPGDERQPAWAWRNDLEVEPTQKKVKYRDRVPPERRGLLEELVK